MKRAIASVIVVALVAIATILLLQNNSSKNISPTPTKHMTTPTPKKTFCIPTNLQATITTQGAAGNIYGALEIKNISSSLCTIQGNQFITASFSAQNLSVVTKGQKGPTNIALKPNQTVYSQIHFPNGPQCQGPIKQTPVTFSYAISPTAHITFKPKGNLSTLTVTTCTNLNQPTQLDVWSIYLQPNIQ